jgi:hypothetical protein
LNEVILEDFTPVSRLAELLEIPAVRVIEYGFCELGLLLTICEFVAFETASAIAAEFGFRARRRRP